MNNHDREIDITRTSVSAMLAGSKATLERCEEDAEDMNAERTAGFIRQAQAYIGMAEAAWRNNQ